MKNILWYLKKYGNESFEKLPFNEIDALIFSEIGYLNLELFSNDQNEKVYIKDVLKKENAKKLAYGSTVRLKNEKLCIAIEKTSRYNDVYFKHSRYILDNEKVEQFFATTFFINDFIYVVYRGTDLTITGWEEDLNMSFLNEVPSQKDAAIYLMDIINLYNKKIMIGGHSKGGNLALYAAIFSERDVKDFIIKIYDFDGPGFLDKDILKSDDFVYIKDRLVAMSSTVSMVAMTLYNVDEIEFLKTKGLGLLQHDPFNWKLESNNRFKRVKINSISSRRFENFNKQFITKTTKEERKRYIETLAKIAKEKPDSSLLDIRRRPFRYLKKMRERRKLLDKESSIFYKMMSKRIIRFYIDARKNVKKEKRFR